MAACRDPHGTPPHREGLIDADPDGITVGRHAGAGPHHHDHGMQGRRGRDITVGDYLALLDAMHQTGTGGAEWPLVYRLLHGWGTGGRTGRSPGGCSCKPPGNARSRDWSTATRCKAGWSGDLPCITCGNASPPWTMFLVQPGRGPGPAGSDETWKPASRDRLDRLPRDTAGAWRHRISYRPVTAAAPGGGKTEALGPARARAAQ